MGYSQWFQVFFNTILLPMKTLENIWSRAHTMKQHFKKMNEDCVHFHVKTILMALRHIGSKYISPFSSESTMSTNVIHLADNDESDMKSSRHQDDVNLENNDESTVGIKSKFKKNRFFITPCLNRAIGSTQWTNPIEPKILQYIIKIIKKSEWIRTEDRHQII